MDPRVRTPAKGLEQQFSLSMECFQGMQAIYEASEKVRKLQAQLKKLREQLAKTNNDKDAKASPPSSSDSPLSQTIEKFDESLASLLGSERPRRGGRRRAKPDKVSLSSISTELNTLLEILQGADATPTTQTVAACAEAKKNLADLMSRCKELQTKDMKSLNDLIRQTNMTGHQHLPEIKLGAETP
jgi:DNA repair exonuclease SbcCD ATPase subunit